MSAPETGERLRGEAARRAPTLTRMLAWAGVDAQRLEAARVVLGERSLRASGSVVGAGQEGIEPYCASYSLATDDRGVLRRLTVRTIRARGEQHVTLTRSQEGLWLVDHGTGAARTDFDGALDADLAFSPLFNALPVRRLGLHRTVTEYRDLAMVFVDLPSLEVCLVRQSYRTVALGDPVVIGFAGDGVQVELTVDVDGLAIDYPGLAKRA